MIGKFNELVSVAKVIGGYISDALCMLCDITDLHQFNNDNKEDNENE